jgi:hypothetical protein
VRSWPELSTRRPGALRLEVVARLGERQARCCGDLGDDGALKPGGV